MKPAQHQVCLLLGSNIAPDKNLPLCTRLLSTLLDVTRVSSVWESPAVGSDGPDFLNAALLAYTGLDAAALKEQVIHPLEAQLGRVRTVDKNSPRTIDIDLILFDGQQVDAMLWQYAYRALPVAELLPEYRSETGALLKDAADILARSMRIRLRTDVTIGPVPAAPREAEWPDGDAR